MKDYLIEHLQEISDLLPGKFYWKDQAGHYLGCNKSVLEELGFEHLDQLIGKTDYDLWPDYANELRQNDQLVMATEKTLFFEELISHNSIEKYFVVTKKPLYNKEGKVIGIIGNSIPSDEIRDRQFLLSNEKDKALKEYKVTTKYLQDIVDSIPWNVYWKDKEGVWLGCNEYTLKTAGIKSACDIIGKTDYELWAAQASELRKNDKQVMESGKLVRNEEMVILPNGQKKYFSAVKMPLHDDENNIVGIVGNSLEITESKEI